MELRAETVEQAARMTDELVFVGWFTSRSPVESAAAQLAHVAADVPDDELADFVSEVMFRLEQRLTAVFADLDQG